MLTSCNSGVKKDNKETIAKPNIVFIFTEIHKILLFDLTNDPEEMTNLTANLEQSARVKKLFKDLLKLQKEMDDSLNLTDLYNIL